MKSTILSCIVVSALLIVATGCSNDDTVLNTEKKTTENKEDTNVTTFISADQSNTRTSLNYQTGAFFWENGDHIYVKDASGSFKKSTNAVSSAQQAHFKFMMPGSYPLNQYMVYYPGENSSNDQVIIADAQTQQTPNNTNHFGKSGDCGLGKAQKNANGQFEFKLDHKAAYLCFLPYTSHTLVSTYITKIEVSSDDNIAGIYTLDAANNKLTGSGSEKTITLTTKGSGAYADGFPLNNNTSNLSTNSAFMVIAPGSHKLTVKYYVKDTQTNVEGVIIKKLKSFNYKAKEYYDIASKLDVKAHDGTYYMWDAKKNYWAGYESTQPKKNGDTNNNYPTATDANRWYNKVKHPKLASNTAKNCPNINECYWYCLKGDPHWDNTTLWTVWGHLYTGGMWFKKASVIAAENGKANANALKLATPNNHDYTTEKFWGTMPNNTQITAGTPANSSNYFFLPAMGYYDKGKLKEFRETARYWSSTPEAYFSQRAYSFFFKSDNVVVSNAHDRDNGFCIWRTE